MAGIYGPITEDNRYPVTDARHFTVTIIPHKYTEGEDVYRDGCNDCGFSEDMPFHCSCETKHPFGKLGVHYTDCAMYRLGMATTQELDNASVE